MKNLEKRYEAIQPEMDVIRAIVDARTSQNLTQKELAELLVLIRLILVSLKMEQEILLSIYLKD